MRSHFQFLQHTYAEAILSYLSQLGHERRTRPPLSTHLCEQLPPLTLYIGGTAQDATRDEYVTLCGRKLHLDCCPLVCRGFC